MRYKKLAQLLIDQIHDGRLQQGQRLPSLRRLAQQHQVSLTTALNCYHRLEELGFASAQPQSGFYVASPLVQQQLPEQPQFVSSAQPAKFREPLQVLAGPLGVSQLAPELLPTQALQKSLRKASRQLAQQLHRYPDSQGESALRQALVEHFARYSFAFSAEQLVITNGCLDAVRTAVEVTTKPGQAVAVSSPCFNGLLQLLTQLGREVVEIPSTESGIDIAQLEHHMQRGSIAACLLSANHMNPTGLCLSAEQKQRLAQLAKQYQIAIIEDDIFLELSQRREPPLPIKHWDSHGYVLWCGSVSKTLSAGLRLGWCLPGRYLERYKQMRRWQNFGVSSPIQFAIADFIRSQNYHRHLQLLRPKLAQQICLYRQLLSERLPDSARISCPEGGLVLWLQLPGLDSVLLAKLAQQLAIDLRLGVEFTSRTLYQDFLRLNCGWPLVDSEGQPSLAAHQLELLSKHITELMD